MERGILCLCVKTLMGAVRETTPTLIQSPFRVPGRLPFPPSPPPCLSHPIFVCPPTPGGAFPSLLQAPRGGGGSLEGMCGLYGFIYNILKKIKNLYEKYQIAPLSPIPGFCPLFLFKKRNKTHFCTGRGRDREGGLAIPLTTIKLRREQVFGVAVCLSLYPLLYHWEGEMQGWF